MLSYTVVIPAHLHAAYAHLADMERLDVGLHLLTLAEASAVTHDAGAGAGPWSELAGLSAGDHRRLFGTLWLAYSIRPEEEELLLLDFGEAHLPSLTTSLPLRTSDWRHAGAAEDAWINEGGFEQRSSGPLGHPALRQL